MTGKVSEHTLIKFMENNEKFQSDTMNALAELKTDVGIIKAWKDNYESSEKKVSRLWVAIGALSTIILTLLGFLVNLLIK